MSEIAEGDGGGKKGGKKRAKKQSTRIDMTPMVDLAFLLLTFFVLTATFSKPKSMELTFPAPPPPDQKPDEVKNGITFLLSKDDRIFYYEGQYRAADDDKGKKTTLEELNFSKESLRKYILEKNKDMQQQVKDLIAKHDRKELADTTFKRLVRERKADKLAPTFLIKTDDKATYRNVIDVIDELNYNVVGKYVMVDILQSELNLVNEKIGPTN